VNYIWVCDKITLYGRKNRGEYTLYLTDERTNDRPVGRKTSFLAFLLLVTLVLGVAFLAYLESNDIDFRTANLKNVIADIFSSTKEQDAIKIINEIGYSIKEKAVFGTYGDYLIKCTTEGITWINKKGEQVQNIALTMNRPAVRTAGAYLLVADLGGKDIKVFRNTSLHWNFSSETNIINADINEDGLVTIVHEANGYKARVSVYHPLADRPLAFTRTIAECFVLSAKLSPSGKQLVINKIDSRGIRAGTHIEFNHLAQEEPYSNIFRENTIYPALWFTGDGSLFAAGDSEVAYFDREGTLAWEKTYDNGIVYSSNLCSGKYPVVAVADISTQGNGKNTRIDVMNAKGDVMVSYPVEGEVINIQTFSNTIAVNLGREVLFINIQGNEIGRFTARSEVYGVYFMDRKTAAIVTKEGISIINIG